VNPGLVCNILTSQSFSRSQRVTGRSQAGRRQLATGSKLRTSRQGAAGNAQRAKRIAQKPIESVEPREPSNSRLRTASRFGAGTVELPNAFLGPLSPLVPSWQQAASSGQAIRNKLAVGSRRLAAQKNTEQPNCRTPYSDGVTDGLGRGDATLAHLEGGL
jgi:hypothetical protein